MPAEPKADTPTPEPAPLSKASGSTSPIVHQLIAEQEIARQAGDDDVVVAKAAELRDLGYE